MTSMDDLQPQPAPQKRMVKRTAIPFKPHKVDKGMLTANNKGPTLISTEVLRRANSVDIVQQLDIPTSPVKLIKSSSKQSQLHLQQ